MQGQQFSGVLPYRDPLEQYVQLKQLQDQEAYRKYSVQRQQQEHQDNMLKYVLDKMDGQNILTATPFDPILSSTMNQKLQDISQKIKNGEDDASVLFETASAANQMNAYAQKAKNIRAQADNAAKELAKNSSIDPLKLRNRVLANAAMMYDPTTHTIKTKPLEGIDDNTDWVDYTIKNNPEDFTTGPGAISDVIGKDKMIPYKKEWTVDKGGVRRIMGYEGKYSPLYHDTVDENGNVVNGENGNVTGVAVKSSPVVIAGQSLKAVPENVYEHFSGDLGVQAYLNKETKDFLKYQPDASPDAVKRVLLYDYLNSDKRGYINNTKNTVDESQLQSENFQRGMKYLAESFKSAVSSKDQHRISNSPLIGVMGALSGDESYMGDQTEEVPYIGKKLINITPFIPGGALYQMKGKNSANGTASREAFAGVLVDPETNTLYTKDVKGIKRDKDGYPVKDQYGNNELVFSYAPVPKDEELPYLQQLGEANGLHKDEVTAIYNQSVKKKREQENEIYKQRSTQAQQDKIGSDAEQRLQGGLFGRLFQRIKRK
jgi:hypothetical protein